MKPALHQLEFDGALLARGFWLYVWEITTKDGGKVHYVGRTGDSSSLNAQSPFARLSQHLGWNEKSNALRRNLEAHKLIAEECQAFRLFACGPIFHESKSEVKHRHSRDVVAALEKALADAMHAAGYELLNEVKCRKALDPDLWREVAGTFGKHFQNLQHRAFKREL
jgi:hypothetical protein